MVPGATDAIVNGVVPAACPLMITDEPVGRESTMRLPVMGDAGLVSRDDREDAGAEIGESCTSTERDGRSAVSVTRRSFGTYPGRLRTIVLVPSATSLSVSGVVPRAVPSTVTTAPEGELRISRLAVSRGEGELLATGGAGGGVRTGSATAVRAASGGGGAGAGGAGETAASVNSFAGWASAAVTWPFAAGRLASVGWTRDVANM